MAAIGFEAMDSLLRCHGDIHETIMGKEMEITNNTDFFTEFLRFDILTVNFDNVLRCTSSTRLTNDMKLRCRGFKEAQMSAVRSVLLSSMSFDNQT